MSDALTTPIAGPQAWLGADMADSREWIRAFLPREIDEIDATLRAVQRRGLSWPKFGRDDFPLPTFARELAGVSRGPVHHPVLPHFRGGGPEASGGVPRGGIAQPA
jgi:hypothetical protein